MCAKFHDDRLIGLGVNLKQTNKFLYIYIDKCHKILKQDKFMTSFTHLGAMLLYALYENNHIILKLFSIFRQFSK